MINDRQRHLIDLAREGRHRVDAPPTARGWASGSGEIHSCGDRVTLHLRIGENRVEAAEYEGVGCSLALAASELVCAAVSGVSRAFALTALEDWSRYLAGGDGEPESLEVLEPLSLVRDYPARRSCVLLPLGCAVEALRRDN